jgi:hypothetical protein
MSRIDMQALRSRILTAHTSAAIPSMWLFTAHNSESGSALMVVRPNTIHQHVMVGRTL